jgi:peptidoglycan/xylan/chitin deacetylase (PgdA/CDA1 family)
MSPRRSLCALTALVAAACVAFSGAAEAGEVALTFDDLPGLSLVADQPYLDYLNLMLLRGLRRHHFAATGFVNESKLEGPVPARQKANLKAWLDAGMNLGNHTFSHDSPDELGAAGYIADIARGEPETRALLASRGKKLEWFRHPYLETGAPAAVKHEINAWLEAHGYRIAPVTIDADDWEFAEPYDYALSMHDETLRLKVRAAYLEHTERTIAWSQKASEGLFGRKIPLVILLHATRLNADTLDALADILRRRELRVIPLERAMADPAYRTHDPYVGHDGIEWLERWSKTLHKDLPWDSWQDPPKWIETLYDRLQNDRRSITPPEADALASAPESARPK